MGLVNKANKLLQGVRRRRNELRSPRQLKGEKVNIRSTGGFGRFIAKHKLRRHRLNPEEQTDGKPGDTTKAAMEFEMEYVHEHAIQQMEQPRVSRAIAQPQCIQIAEVEDEEEEDEEEEDEEEDQGEDEGDGEEDLSGEENDDDESGDEVEESVIEDMRKLEESFRGISRKYRLINRIGEGDMNTYTYQVPRRQSDEHLRHILHRLQS